MKKHLENFQQWKRAEQYRCVYIFKGIIFVQNIRFYVQAIIL